LLSRSVGGLRSPLAQRLMAGIILLSSLITLVLSAAQLYFAYREDLRRIDATFRQVSEVHLTSLAQSLWTVNRRDLQLQLDGLVRIPDVEFAEVREANQLEASAGRRVSSDVIERRYPMTHDFGGQVLNIGTLSVVAGLDQIHARLWREALSILISNGFKTFLVAGFGLLLFHFLVNRHLLAIAAHVKVREPTAPPAPLDLGRRAWARRDEIDELADAINLDARRLWQSVTELRESEAGLQESQRIARLGSFFFDLAEGTWTSSVAFDELLGIGPEYVRSRSGWLDLVHPADRAAMAAMIEPGSRETRSVIDLEHRISRPGELEERWLWTRARLERSPDGRMGFRGTCLDITERKRAEAEKAKLQTQVWQAQKMESIGRLAGGVAHDCNNMLAVVLGQAELGLMELHPGDPLHSSLMEIQAAAERAVGMTRQLLTFARRQGGDPRPVETNRAVDRSLSLIRNLIGENIEVVWKPGVEVWPVRLDPGHLDQILTNLCLNARDAIASVGTIRVETENRQVDEAYVRTHPQAIAGDFVRIGVSDTGTGMEPGIASQIFEPFFTTKAVGEGTGLGLAVVGGLVGHSGGFVVVTTTPGQGASFDVFLPRFPGQPEEPAPRDAGPSAPGGGETILVAEDEPSLLKMISRMLKEGGYAVLGVSRPSEALQMAKSHVGRIDLLLTDVVMPEMNGRELAQAILEQHPHIKVIFISGYPDAVLEPDREKEEQEPAAVLRKPFRQDQLIALIRQVMDREEPLPDPFKSR